MVRSLSESSYEVAAGSTTDPVAALRSIGITPTETRASHMLVPEMQNIAAGRMGGPTERLGLRTFRAETQVGAVASDLSTSAGRVAAAAKYDEQITRLLDDNTFIVGNRVGSFDIPKIINSAAALEEFMEDPARAEKLLRLQQKLNSGTGVIDVTQIAGEHIFEKLAEIQKTAAASGASPESMLDASVRGLLSPETALKAGRFGESVKPRSIESVLLSTDLLERMMSTPEGREIVEKLATGATHTSDVDSQLSMAILRGAAADEMDLLTTTSGRGYLGGTKLPDADVALLERARTAISMSSAPTPTTNIANIEEVSDRVLNFFATTDDERILSGVRISQPGGAYLEYNPASAQYERILSDGRIAPVASGRARYEINTAIAQARDEAQRDIAAIASGSPRPPMTKRSNILNLGITMSEAGQMERTLQFADMGAHAPVDMADLLSTEAGQESFVEAMSVTRRNVGLPHLHERNMLVDRVMGRSMRDRYDVYDEANLVPGMQALKLGGAGLELLDPVIRSNFVAASTITSSVAFDTDLGRKATARRIAKQQFLLENPAATADEVSAHIAALTEEQMDNYAKRASQVNRYLSEMGVVTFEETTPKIISGTTGGVARIRVSQRTLESMTVTEGGTEVSLLGSNFMKRSGLTRMHMSEVKLTDGRSMVNLVMGEGSMARTEAQTFAESLVNLMRRKVIDEGLDDDTLINVEKLFSSKEEISEVRRILQGSSDEVKEGLIDPIVKQFTESGGPIRGTVRGEVAEGLSSLMHSISQGVGNDQVGVRTGMVFEAAGVDEGLVYATPTLGRKAMAHAESLGIAMPEAKDILERRDIVLAKANQNKGFRSLLRKAFGRHGVDEGIMGSSIGADRAMSRAARDESLKTMVKAAKPVIYKTGIAVAALSAGYYLARRNRDQQLYDQVMHEQPLENPGLTQQTNYDTQDTMQMASTRRDPLVTAGVVGNLDRNKIGHTMMGPNKYNHLFGE